MAQAQAPLTAREARLLSIEDKRDILEAAGSAAFGFATLHEYIRWRERDGRSVSWIEKFAVMLVVTAAVFALLRLLTKWLWPLPGE